MELQAIFQINLTLIDDIIIKLTAVDKDNTELFSFENKEGIGKNKTALRIFNLTQRKNTRFTKSPEVKTDNQKLIKWVQKNAELLIIDFFNEDIYLGNIVVNQQFYNASHLPLPLRFDFEYTCIILKLERKIRKEIQIPSLYHLNGQQLNEHPKFKNATHFEIINTFFY